MTAPIDLPDAILREATPEDDIVLAYVTRGALAKYVEGVAARNHAFRDELEAVIDGLDEAGETISAAARDWRRPARLNTGGMTPPEPLMPFPQKKRSSVLPWSAFAFAAALLLAYGGNAHMEKRENARIQALKDQEIAEKNAQLEKLMADLKAQSEAMAAAQSDLANAKSDADRAEAQAKLAAAQDQQRRTQAGVGMMGIPARPTKPAAGAPPKACACEPGDPLCSCK